MPEKNINWNLVNLAKPFLLLAAKILGRNNFDRQTIYSILRAVNCPTHLLEEVVEQCIKAGIIIVDRDNGMLIINTNFKS